MAEAHPAPPWEYGRSWNAALLAGVLPLVVLSWFAAPQTDDFCYGAMVLRHGLAAVWQHYDTWSGRLVASTLIPLPSVVSNLLGADLFTVYRFFVVAFVLGFSCLCYWLV